jgi:hypothetical protein
MCSHNQSKKSITSPTTKSNSGAILGSPDDMMQLLQNFTATVQNLQAQ